MTDEYDGFDCVDAWCRVHPEHDFPPGAYECRRCGAETDDDGPDGIYDGEIR